MILYQIILFKFDLNKMHKINRTQNNFLPNHENIYNEIDKIDGVVANDLYDLAYELENELGDELGDELEDRLEYGEEDILDEFYDNKNEIPNDVLLYNTWHFLPTDALLYYCSTNRVLSKICKNDETWYYLLERDFGKANYRKTVLNKKKKQVNYTPKIEYENVSRIEAIISKYNAPIYARNIVGRFVFIKNPIIRVTTKDGSYKYSLDTGTSAEYFNTNDFIYYAAKIDKNATNEFIEKHHTSGNEPISKNDAMVFLLKLIKSNNLLLNVKDICKIAQPIKHLLSNYKTSCK